MFDTLPRYVVMGGSARQFQDALPRLKQDGKLAWLNWSGSASLQRASQGTGCRASQGTVSGGLGGVTAETRGEVATRRVQVQARSRTTMSYTRSEQSTTAPAARYAFLVR